MCGANYKPSKRKRLHGLARETSSVDLGNGKQRDRKIEPAFATVVETDESEPDASLAKPDVERSDSVSGSDTTVDQHCNPPLNGNVCSVKSKRLRFASASDEEITDTRYEESEPEAVTPQLNTLHTDLDDTLARLERSVLEDSFMKLPRPAKPAQTQRRNSEVILASNLVRSADMSATLRTSTPKPDRRSDGPPVFSIDPFELSSSKEHPDLCGKVGNMELSGRQSKFQQVASLNLYINGSSCECMTQRKHSLQQQILEPAEDSCVQDRSVSRRASEDIVTRYNRDRSHSVSRSFDNSLNHSHVKDNNTVNTHEGFVHSTLSVAPRTAYQPTRWNSFQTPSHNVENKVTRKFSMC